MAEPIRFYTDEHVGRSIISGLRRRGVDVLTVPEADLLGASDFEHLRFATSQGRVLFTQDDDFLRLHAQGLQHSGIVYAHQRVYQHATLNCGACPAKPHLSKVGF